MFETMAEYNVKNIFMRVDKFISTHLIYKPLK